MFVKICGITGEDDALLAVALGADALGFVFAPSRRQVREQAVADIVRRLPHGIITLGVFRNERPEVVVGIVNRLGLTGAQLHGREPGSEVREIRSRVRLVVQAFSASDPALARARDWGADAVLVDGADPGSGLAFDWSLAEGVPDGVRFILAGGLTADNVGEAIRRVRPWGVDVSTGVESEPGRKDPAKLRRFVEEARRAGAEAFPDAPDGEEAYDWAVDDWGVSEDGAVDDPSGSW
ncbi:MAG: phosphoribosylanthranilate isomerase, partial [Acidimicrobiia bacterium]